MPLHHRQRNQLFIPPPATPAADGAGAVTEDAEQDAHPPLAPIAEADEAEENPAAAENNADGGNAAGAEEEEAQPTPGGAGEMTAGGG